ncbi:hypothetical protein [Caballeronia sp. DA-9]|uniref:hypothetical protein n=1 Tax=Caballeronia sp. DA-9 TaxID=3436237 RepID=UPI003F66160F
MHTRVNTETQENSIVGASIAGVLDTDAIHGPEAENAALIEFASQDIKKAPKPFDVKEVFGKGDPNYSPSIAPFDPATDKTVLAFRETIAECESKGDGYRSALNETLAVAYAAYYMYEAKAGKYAKDAIFEFLKSRVKEYTKNKTGAEHMILELTFGEMTTATKSQRARLFRLAYSKAEGHVTPARFLKWLDGKGGIVNALKPKNPKSPETMAKERQTRLESTRLKVHTYVLGEVKDIPVKGLGPASDKALALAVIERNADGTFVVLGFTDDEFALNTACNAYGKTIK